ncbi:condensation domain-containing protein [Aurantibacter sp.]|uniref:condensation domain-containing protein n=1 Tax=Aurantibacter sp. TaxID=2807103 RepID=UPI0032643783
MRPTEIKDRIDGLSDKAKKLFLLKIDQALQSSETEVIASGRQHLVAYVEGSDNFESEALKKHLKMSLPEYMVPSSIILVEEFPKLPNGKIDRNKLNSLNVIQRKNKTIISKSSTSETEQALIKIWEEVLGFSPIDVNDNFFEIGGDSILSIQIIARARKAGIMLEANQIFDHQSISELSLFTKKLASKVSQTDTKGTVLLTPIQQRFFSINVSAPNYWNQIVQVYGLGDIQYHFVKNIVHELVDYHEGLRLCFYKIDNQWKSKIVETIQKEVFHYIDLSNIISFDNQNNNISEKLISIQKNVDLSNGNLFQGVYFNCGETQENKFMMIAHHLVIDMVSWNIIFDDFIQAFSQDKTDEEINFKEKTDSIKQWGEILYSKTQSTDLNKEIEFWQEQCIETEHFPSDFKVENSIYRESTIGIYQSIIHRENLRDLLKNVNETYNTRTEDLLITALFTTITDWTNSSNLVLGLEHNGRHSTNLDIDISNTVGWFTSFFPILFEKEKSNDKGNLVSSIKEKLRSVPNNGIGFGLLKYMSGEDCFNLFDGEPQIIFNYLGVQNNAINNSNLIFEQLSNYSRDPHSERTYGIEINAFIKNDKIQVNWSYTNTLYKESTIKILSQNFENNLQALYDYCLNKEGNYTPSDFPEADLSQDDLDNLMQQFE